MKFSFKYKTLFLNVTVGLGPYSELRNRDQSENRCAQEPEAQRGGIFGAGAEATSRVTPWNPLSVSWVSFSILPSPHPDT